MAEQFTGMAGQYVPLKETHARLSRRSWTASCDDLPESGFLFAGTIDDVLRQGEEIIRLKEVAYGNIFL